MRVFLIVALILDFLWYAWIRYFIFKWLGMGDWVVESTVWANSNVVAIVICLAFILRMQSATARFLAIPVSLVMLVWNTYWIIQVSMDFIEVSSTLNLFWVWLVATQTFIYALVLKNTDLHLFLYRLPIMPRVCKFVPIFDFKKIK